jgi:hypothetical protein
MEQYITISVYIKNNQVASIHTHVKYETEDYIDWFFNNYKAEPEYITDIVVSDNLKGVLLTSTLYCDFEYHQMIKSESITEAIDIVLEIVNKHVLNRADEFEQLRKAKKIELLEKQAEQLRKEVVACYQAQELIEQANKLK